jgi:hypothetical protein
MEHTLYHYCIPQDSEKNVWKALEMFSSFFKCPLLNDKSMERELHAVESEFELNKKDDDNRLGQLMSYTCGMDGEARIMGREWRRRSTTATGDDDGDDDARRAAEEEAAGGAGGKGDATERPFHPFAKVHTFAALPSRTMFARVSPSIPSTSKDNAPFLIVYFLFFIARRPTLKISFPGEIWHR